MAIRRCRDIVEHSGGPRFVAVVTGGRSSCRFWTDRLAAVKRSVFRRDGATDVLVIDEPVPRGNFLGTLAAWKAIRAAVPGDRLPPVMLVSMTMGMGKRLSPFTQVLGNRKSALPTPFLAHDGQVLCAGDLSNLYANSWIAHLESVGFRGVVVKWGDEAVIPSRDFAASWPAGTSVDAVRFGWRTTPTRDLATEKEWLLFDGASHLVRAQLARQPLAHLERRLERRGGHGDFAVNLGSFAVTYRMLDAALDAFGPDVEDTARTADWDPYIWMALHASREEWDAERAREAEIGAGGIARLERQIPDFLAKVDALRAGVIEPAEGVRSVMIDFGDPLWVDLGLHLSLRRSLELLVQTGEKSDAIREVFNVSSGRDERGNTIVASRIPAGADIRDSVIVNSVIADARSLVRGAVVAHSRLGTVDMPDGGAVLSSAVGRLRFDGPNCIALRSMAADVQLPAGGRHATLCLPDGPVSLVSNEDVTDYSGDRYALPAFGNPLSFERAGELAGTLDPTELDALWTKEWPGGAVPSDE